MITRLRQTLRYCLAPTTTTPASSRSVVWPRRALSSTRLSSNNISQTTGQGPRPSSPASRRETYPVVSPRTRAEVHQVQNARMPDIDRAIDTAHNARQSWASTPVGQRSEIIRRAATLLKDEASGWRERLYDSDRAETSVSEWWARQQLTDVVGFMRALADSAEGALASSSRTEGSWTVHTQHEPYGVCLAIAAWNAVHLLTSRAIITPLLAGNTVILKSSELAPRTQSLWADLLFEAGLLVDCLKVVHVTPEASKHLVPRMIQNDKIRHINFTGSSRTGSKIASLAGRHLKPTLMELGGKAAVLVLPDADLDQAASHILFGAWMNAGQICMSTERMLVPGSMYDGLVTALQNSWQTMQQKEPMVLASQHAVQQVQDLVNDALDKGAKPLLQRHQADSEGAWCVQPNVYGPLDKSMKLYHDESFGPIAGIIPVADGPDDQATINAMVGIANESKYGLSASVWSSDETKALQVARRLESGAVHVNGATCLDLPHTPHGGWKSSGWGRFNGAEGLRHFAQTRCITVPTAPPAALPLDILLK